MKKMTIPADNQYLAEGVDFVKESLAGYRIKGEKKATSILAAEEILVNLIEKAAPSSQLTIEIRKSLGNVNIRMKCRGESLQITDITNQIYFQTDKDEDEEVNTVISGILQKVFGGDLSVRNTSGINKVRYNVLSSSYKALFTIVLSLIMGVLTGCLMKTFLPVPVVDAVSENVFDIVYVVFMNALKLIVAPLVFFSVASSIADFGDIKVLGKLAGKIVATYVLTSCVAILVGICVYHFLPIGSPALSNAVDSSATDLITTAQTTTVSIKNTLINIIPSDIISPFLNSNMIQIIFISVVLGVSSSAMADSYPGFKRFLAGMNQLCSNLTSGLMVFMPLMVFCSMAKMMIQMDFIYLGNVLILIPVCYIGLAIMLLFYLLSLLVFGRLNPIKFLSKFYKAALTAVSLNSSNASIPFTAKGCDNLGIPRRIYSFSVPLGATINMNGSCICMIVSTMFLAKVFSITVTPGMLLGVIMTVLVMSVGAPGVPGSTLVCITMIIQQIGAPAEGISLIMGIYPIIGMILTGINVVGDATVTTIVTRRAGLLDLKKYQS